MSYKHQVDHRWTTVPNKMHVIYVKCTMYKYDLLLKKFPFVTYARVHNTELILWVFFKQKNLHERNQPALY